MLAALFFYLIFGLYCAVGQDSPDKDAVNIKTVLFRDTDACKACWSLEDIQLLVSRKILQDLIPRKLPEDFEKLAKYVKMVIEMVRTKAPPESAQRVSLAAYDVMGGYLKSIGIPVLNEAYYAGNVPYNIAAEIHCLYGKIMAALKTDGGGWSGPIDMTKIPTKVRALNIAITNSTEACNTLDLRPNSLSTENTFQSQEPSKISIPYLDDNSYPNAIAVPLRGNSLFSLMSNCSANLLPKFYILAMRCLACTCFTKKDIITFNHRFYEWIISSVVPHLHENDRWYPGFGGVMRIIETMNQRGLASHDNVRPDTAPCSNEIPDSDEFDDSTSGGTFSRKNLIIALTGIFIVMFFVCCCCCCLMKKCSKPPPPAPEDSNDGLAKTLVSIYCGVKDTIVGGKNAPQQPLIKERTKSSSKSSGRFDQSGGHYYTSTDDGDTSEATSCD